MPSLRRVVSAPFSEGRPAPHAALPLHTSELVPDCRQPPDPLRFTPWCRPMPTIASPSAGTARRPKRFRDGDRVNVRYEDAAGNDAWAPATVNVGIWTQSESKGYYYRVTCDFGEGFDADRYMDFELPGEDEELEVGRVRAHGRPQLVERA